MIKRKYMRTRQLKPGMKLDHPVVDRLGRNLVARGVPLDDYLIDSLIKLGIMSVYIQIGEDAEEKEALPVSEKAKENIEKLRTEDRSKVTLSASVRNVFPPESSSSTTMQILKRGLLPPKPLLMIS